MSWKPYRGSGICFDKAYRREVKYRIMLEEAKYKPLSIGEYSRLYYLWLIADRDVNSGFGVCKPVNYGSFIPQSTLQSLENHRDLCYKPLLQFMPTDKEQK